MPDKKIVFLFDVDNTLLDNDHVTADLKRHLHSHVGPERSQRYWQRFEEIRSELGYADYLGALQRYRIDHPHDPHLLAVSYFLMRYPFANRLFPNSVDAVQHVGQWGRPVILSDGDVVFQPHKVYRSGLFELFDGHVLIYVHKEHELEDVMERYPAEHYVLVDDKLRILQAIKEFGNRASPRSLCGKDIMHTIPRSSRSIRRRTSAWSESAICSITAWTASASWRKRPSKRSSRYLAGSVTARSSLGLSIYNRKNDAQWRRHASDTYLQRPIAGRHGTGNLDVQDRDPRRRALAPHPPPSPANY